MKTKYEIWHDQIINRARARVLECYRERHHIIPRSLNGEGDPSNLVDLTYREHYLIHWLLTKLYVGYAKRKMIYAFRAMTIPLTSRPYIATWRIDAAKRAIKGEILRRAEVQAAIRFEAKKAQRLALAGNIKDAPSSLNIRINADRYTMSKMANALILSARADGELKRNGTRRKQGKQYRRVYDPAYEFSETPLAHGAQEKQQTLVRPEKQRATGFLKKNRTRFLNSPLVRWER